MTVRAADMRSRELARWLTLHGLTGCICTYLPTGTANWYLYRAIENCHYEHSDAPPDPPLPYVPRCGPDDPCIDCA